MGRRPGSHLISEGKSRFTTEASQTGRFQTSRKMVLYVAPPTAALPPPPQQTNAGFAGGPDLHPSKPTPCPVPRHPLQFVPGHPLQFLVRGVGWKGALRSFLFSIDLLFGMIDSAGEAQVGSAGEQPTQE